MSRRKNSVSYLAERAQLVSGINGWLSSAMVLSGDARGEPFGLRPRGPSEARLLDVVFARALHDFKSARRAKFAPLPIASNAIKRRSAP